MKFLITQFIFVSVLRLLHATYRYQVIGLVHREIAEKHHPKGSIVFATWHGNSLAGTMAHAKQNIGPLCSHSPDGRMVATLCRTLGLKPIMGSSSRGGAAARLEILDRLDEGCAAAITVDGPKGPIHVAKSGCVDVAKRTGSAILPLAAIADRSWRLSSWDRLRIPKPFAKVKVIYGPPIFVSEQAQGAVFEAFREQVDKSLMALEPIQT